MKTTMKTTMTHTGNRIRDLLRNAAERLASCSESPRLDAELLLCLALDQPRVYLHTWPDLYPEQDESGLFEQLLSRRLKGEPMAYLNGEREFWSLPLKVTADTLIPRPETEELVALALTHLPEQTDCRVADLGTGSGAIALAIAHERPDCQVTAVDFSDSALQVARKNARRLDIYNVEFHQGNWLQGLHTAFDLIVANPPYIRADDPHLQQGDLPYEPLMALVADDDGLAAINTICRQARHHLRPGGWLILEHGHDQQQAVIRSLREHGYDEIEPFQDLCGNDRIIQARTTYKDRDYPS